MLYYAVGKPHRLPKKLLNEVVDFTAKYLKIENTDCIMEIEFFNKLDACGYAQEEEYVNYSIQISKEKQYTTKDIIATIMHEMVHVAQYIRGDLVLGKGNKLSRWKGKPVDLPYSKQPWERQAFRLEKNIWNKFITKNPNALK